GRRCHRCRHRAPGPGRQARLRHANRHPDHPPRHRPSRHRPGAQRRRVANYIAKYATKTLTAPGLPSHRIRSETDIERLRCPAHYQRLITTAWQLGTRYRAWAHMLGYGGHFLTKSRRYSVTFGQLRAARTEHRRALRPPDADRDAWGRPLDETVVLVLPVIWTYEGTGCPIAAAAELALAT